MSRTDSSLALRPAPVRVDVAGRLFIIPAHSAGKWAEAIASPSLETAILPGMLEGDDAERFIDALMDASISERDLSFAAYRAITAASGRDWWQTTRLIGAYMNEDGRTMGELEMRGVDPFYTSLRRFTSALYALLTQGMDEKQLFKFNANLMLAPVIEGLEIEDKPDDAAEVMQLLRTMPGVSIGG